MHSGDKQAGFELGAHHLNLNKSLNPFGLKQGENT